MLCDVISAVTELMVAAKEVCVTSSVTELMVAAKEVCLEVRLSGVTSSVQ